MFSTARFILASLIVLASQPWASCFAEDLNQRHAYEKRESAQQDLTNGNFESAIDKLTESIELCLEIQRYFYLVERGKAYSEKGDLTAALGDFTAALEMPSNIYDYGREERGDAFLGLRDFQAAILDYDLMIGDNPDHLRSFVRRGLAYEQIGDFKKAKEDYEFAKSAVINPNSEKVSLGFVYYPFDKTENEEATRFAQERLDRITAFEKAGN